MFYKIIQFSFEIPPSWSFSGRGSAGEISFEAFRGLFAGDEPGKPGETGRLDVRWKQKGKKGSGGELPASLKLKINYWYIMILYKVESRDGLESDFLSWKFEVLLCHELLCGESASKLSNSQLPLQLHRLTTLVPPHQKGRPQRTALDEPEVVVDEPEDDAAATWRGCTMKSMIDIFEVVFVLVASVAHVFQSSCFLMTFNGYNKPSERSEFVCGVLSLCVSGNDSHEPNKDDKDESKSTGMNWIRWHLLARDLWDLGWMGKHGSVMQCRSKASCFRHLDSSILSLRYLNQTILSRSLKQQSS